VTENKPSASPLVVLVGPMGAGKTTVGRLLAERLGVGFRDSDEDIERAEGRPIPEIFIDEGEEYFRVLEAAAVRAALIGHDGVLALGGGSVLDPAVRALLAAHPVAFLDVGLHDGIKRVGLDTPRPLLAVNPRARWRELMEARRPLYLEAARVVVPTDGLDPAEVADAVLKALELESA
jgi:shikimate kinase